MSSRVFIFVSRVLFVVMAMTFLSPSMGTNMVADHEHLHAQAMQPDDSSHGHGHEHDADHDEDDPHAVMGHLLLHMPMHLSIAFEFAPPPLITGAELPFPQFSPSFGVPEFPFKPPRAVLFV